MCNKNVNGKLARIRSGDKKKKVSQMVIFAPILVYCIIKMIICPLLFSYKEKKQLIKSFC